MSIKPEYVKGTKKKPEKVEYYTRKGNLVLLFIVGLGLLGFVVMYATIIY